MRAVPRLVWTMVESLPSKVMLPRSRILSVPLTLYRPSAARQTTDPLGLLSMNRWSSSVTSVSPLLSTDARRSQPVALEPPEPEPPDPEPPDPDAGFALYRRVAP